MLRWFSSTIVKLEDAWGLLSLVRFQTSPRCHCVQGGMARDAGEQVEPAVSANAYCYLHLHRGTLIQDED